MENYIEKQEVRGIGTIKNPPPQKVVFLTKYILY